ncbi:unnamed protein product [Linum trigynum]|uniref:Ribosomal protein L32 n=1 Tax=Linum trigynum TaxID=586398 RepID=A0AAV2FC03_9ROSI
MYRGLNLTCPECKKPYVGNCVRCKPTKAEKASPAISKALAKEKDANTRAAAKEKKQVADALNLNKKKKKN